MEGAKLRHKLIRQPRPSFFEQLLAEGYAAGKKGAGTYVASDLPEPFRTAHGRKKQPAPAAMPAGLARDFVDVTTQSDERPFNLGRTLIDARTAELSRLPSPLPKE